MPLKTTATSSDKFRGFLRDVRRVLLADFTPRQPYLRIANLDKLTGDNKDLIVSQLKTVFDIFTSTLTPSDTPLKTLPTLSPPQPNLLFPLTLISPLWLLPLQPLHTTSSHSLLRTLRRQLPKSSPPPLNLFILCLPSMDKAALLIFWPVRK